MKSITSTKYVKEILACHLSGVHTGVHRCTYKVLPFYIVCLPAGRQGRESRLTPRMWGLNIEIRHLGVSLDEFFARRDFFAH